MRCRDGRDHIVQFLIRFVGDTFLIVQWDVTEQRALEAELSRLARRDALTASPIGAPSWRRPRRCSPPSIRFR